MSDGCNRPAVRRLQIIADQAVTVRGEIVDSYCYEDGTRRVYVLMPPKDDSVMPANVIAAAGTTRTVIGRMFVNSGTRFLMVDAIK
ncbi:MAG TPA: hypothetical protein VER58_14160 [Thermoanaerobaculia bacterium]|nr:hypothetical protein [Thermoanaerobaculia bacterium]